MTQREDRWSHLTAPAFKLPAMNSGHMQFEQPKSYDHMLRSGLVIAVLAAILVALASVSVKYALMVS